MFKGTVRWIFKDAMRRTVVVKTELGGGESILTFYVHISPNPDPNFKVGSTVERGALIGTVLHSRNLNSPVAPHLHLGIGIISDTEDAKIGDTPIDFNVLNQWAEEGRIIEYGNPLDIIPPQARQTFFLDGSKANLRIQSVLIKSVDATENEQLEKLFRRAFPGLREYVLQNESEEIIDKPQMLIIRKNAEGLWDIESPDYQQKGVAFDSIIDTVKDVVNAPANDAMISDQRSQLLDSAMSSAVSRKRELQTHISTDFTALVTYLQQQRNF